MIKHHKNQLKINFDRTQTHDQQIKHWYWQKKLMFSVKKNAVHTNVFNKK